MNLPVTEPLIGQAPLMRMALSGVDLAPLSAELLERAAADPNDANALLDMSTVLLLAGQSDLASAMQMQALEICQLYHLPAPGGNAGIRLLAICGPGDMMTNTPLGCLLEGSDVDLDMLYIAPGLPSPESLPDHDVLFFALGVSDQSYPVLTEIDEVIKTWQRPVLNMPDRILNTSREAAYELLRSAPGVIIPATVRIDRQTLARIACGELPLGAALDDGAYPVIIRPIDSHAGQGLEKIDEAAAIAGYLSRMTQDEFYVSPFVDYRAADGLYRKARLVLIDGRPFACHLGISAHWMIHYLNAGMADSAEKRAEEERFMVGFDEGFGLRHAVALRAIDERMGLDYLVIDCAETPDGQLLIFEVDTGAVVHAMDPVDLFPYKQPQMQKVFAAFRAMLDKAVRRGTAPVA